MDETNFLDLGKEHRDFILLATLGGWLHDLGKLDSRFIATHAIESQESKYPHERVFQDIDRKSWSYLSKLIEKRIPSNTRDKKPYFSTNINTIVLYHHGPLDDKLKSDRALELFKIADVEESAEDQGSAGTQQSSPMYMCNIFGTETLFARKEKEEEPGEFVQDLELIDNARQRVFEFLNHEDTLTFLRTSPLEFWDKLSHELHLGLGKTQLCANDILLDQHVWGVSSRFKSFLLAHLLSQPANKKHFRLLSITWNSWDITTPFERLIDVKARGRMLKFLRHQLRCLIEGEYAYGSRIYEDDNGIHFMVPDLNNEEELQNKILDWIDLWTQGEVLAKVKLSESTRFVTQLVQQIQEEKNNLPRISTNSAGYWEEKWKSNSGKPVCPLCRKRPTLSQDEKICKYCKDLRQTNWSLKPNPGEQEFDGNRKECANSLEANGISDSPGKETSWSGECADDHHRVALLVGRIDLRSWLNGQMLHTVFSTSPKDHFGEAASWQGLGEWFEEVPNDLLEPLGQQTFPARRKLIEEKIINELLSLWMKDYQRPFTFPERIKEVNEQFLDDAALPASAVLAMARKAPTAGRLLHTWQTTESFLESCQQKIKEDSLEERQRLLFLITEYQDLTDGFYKMELDDGRQLDGYYFQADKKLRTIEFLTDADIDRLSTTKKILLTREEEKSTQGNRTEVTVEVVETESYLPCRTISISPNLVLMLVPADKAIEAAKLWQATYGNNFAKVQGRLPFHIGLIYMNEHYPMFAALDAARRMVESFDAMSRDWHEADLTDVTESRDQNKYQLELQCERFGYWQLEIPFTRMDGKIDYYHPYQLVLEGNELESRPMSLSGPGGRWTHVTDLKVGDKIGFKPNLFDFVFLDSVSRRLDTGLVLGETRRPHDLLPPEKSPRPYLLERLEDLCKIWQEICNFRGMTETKLRAVSDLLSQNYKEWRAGENDAGKENFEWLVKQVVKKDFGDNAFLEKSIMDGSFFDTLELFQHILKQKMEKEQEE